ncbi:MAG: glucose PTS transporter subunit IIA [Streptococcaceae bacterium]|jgi:PTS system D-glucosamine-specific IIC component/PTS system maltose and glucose-specific IIC component|nr:glucose PTS transporter subunit IIA [Streptococcaceae bacterium]
MMRLKKEQAEAKLYAPVSGEMVPLDKVSDQTFASKMLGDGFAIEPSDRKIVSPVSGTISVQQGHAIGIQSEEGLEILIHLGIDTVALKGTPFNIKARVGDKVQVGALLGEVDWEQVDAASIPKTTLVIITNTADKLEKISAATGKVIAGKEAARCELKQSKSEVKKAGKATGYLQKLGKSLMMPIPIIAAAGIFLGLASVLQNPNIVGPAFVANLDAQNVIGFIKTIIAALFANLPILFAVSVTIGLAKAEKANAAFSSVVAFLLMHVTISYMLSLKGITAATYSVDLLVKSGQSVLEATKAVSMYTSVLGVFSFNMNVFGGVLAGVLAAAIHNRFYKTELPMAISYFGGKRLVPIMTTLFAPVLGVILYFVWPFIGTGIQSLGEIIASAGLFGTFIFGMLERLLIPTGLHNILNQMVRFTPIGGSATIDGKQFVGALNIFNALLAQGHPNMEIMRSATRFLAQGKIPYMMFGLPAAALAMYRTALPENKKKVGALLFAAALTSFTTGITEPIEFLFIFISPILFIFHAIMGGLAFMLTNLLGVAIGNVQGGAIDLGVFGVLRGLDTRWYFELLLGAIYAPVYYFTFKKVIMWKNLKTPGREVEEDLGSSAVMDNAPKLTGDLGHKIIAALGGLGNVESIDNCFTRLRLVLNDASKIDEETLKSTGAVGIVKLDSKNIQVVYGPQVESIALKVKEAAGLSE